MRNPIEYVRPNIRALAPYSTARDDFKGGDISVWLDANESPYDNGVNRYPDPHQRRLKHFISELKGVRPEQIFVGGAGSDEAIDLVYRIFCEPSRDNVVAIDPSYGVYSVAAAINNVEYRQVQLASDFSLPVSRILKAADSHTKVIWICSPNNPTANAFPRADIARVAEAFDGIVAVDEAYIDFSERGSMLELLDEYPNIIVLQTFSKAWGMASLRLGMAFASPEIAELFAKVKYPYNVNGPTQQAVINHIINDDITARVAQIREQRNILARELRTLPIVKEVHPSDANFLLVKFDNANAVYDYLAANGVMVRNRSSMTACGGCLRITVGTPRENERVMELLRQYREDAVEAASVADDDTAAGKDDTAIAASGRSAHIHRNTAETNIDIEIDLDGAGKSAIDTGLKFYDHMLSQLPHHAGISLNIRCKGDLEVDEHHTMEDVAIALGDAIYQALGSKRGIERYGFALPMDESRAVVLLDFGGRSELVWDVEFTREYVGDTPTEMFRHVFKSLASAMHANIYVCARGENNHHLIEGVFKAFARALRQAVMRNPFNYDLPSSKGLL